MKRKTVKTLFRQNIPNAVTVIVVALMLVVYNAWAMPAAAPAGPAAMPGVLSYQGNLTDTAGESVNGNVNITFRLYTVPAGGTALWTEAHTGANAVPVDYGLFNVLLGSLNPIPATVWNSTAVYVGLQVGSDPEMTPREAVGMVPYALMAERAFGLSAADGNPANAVTVDDAGQVTGLIASAAMEIRGQDQDSKLLFHDPGDRWYSMGIDRDDGTKFKINAGGNVGGSNQFTMTPDGRVGIGKTTPLAKLDVDGNINWSGDLQGFTMSQEYLAVRLNNKGSTWTPMTPVANSLCFLTRVSFAEIDSGDDADPESAACGISDIDGDWQLEAYLHKDEDADVWCIARCLSW